MAFQLSNGHVMEYVVACALGFDGRGMWHEKWLKPLHLLTPSLFTVVTKTLTYQPGEGNFRWYKPFVVRPLKGGGTVNSVALRNEGIEWWCQEVGPKADSKKVPLVVSILSKDNSAYELVEMTKMVKDFDIVGIEINVSCPNTGTDFISFANSADNIDRMIRGCWAVRDETDHPIILKLSPAHKPKTCEKVTAGVQGGVEALAINSVPWSIAFPDKKSSLAHLGGGGVSGRIAQVHTWRMANDLRNITDIPVIWPGVWDYEDIKILWKIGADAISFSSIFFLGPWKPTIFVRRDVRCRT